MFDPTVELSEAEFKKIVRDIFHFGDVSYGPHVRARMEERNFLFSDIKYILKNGTLKKTEFNEERDQWKYTLSGEDIDGDEGVVVTAIVSDRRIFLVTVI